MFARASVAHLGSSSVPTARRPAWIASTSVVPIPHIGSSTRSPGSLYASIARRRASAGSIFPGCRFDAGSVAGRGAATGRCAARTARPRAADQRCDTARGSASAVCVAAGLMSRGSLGLCVRRRAGVGVAGVVLCGHIGFAFRLVLVGVAEPVLVVVGLLGGDEDRRERAARGEVREGHKRRWWCAVARMRGVRAVQRDHPLDACARGGRRLVGEHHEHRGNVR